MGVRFQQIKRSNNVAFCALFVLLVIYRQLWMQSEYKDFI